MLAKMLGKVSVAIVLGIAVLNAPAKGWAQETTLVCYHNGPGSRGPWILKFDLGTRRATFSFYDTVGSVDEVTDETIKFSLPPGTLLAVPSRSFIFRLNRYTGEMWRGYQDGSGPVVMQGPHDFDCKPGNRQF